MGEQEIINLFLRRGYQLDPDSLLYFREAPNEIEPFLEKIEMTEMKPKIITMGFVRELVKKTGIPVELIKGATSKRKKSTVQDYVQYFSNRYEKINNLIHKRLTLLSLMSIGKVTPRVKNFSIIGAVKEKDHEQKTVVLEDQTGEILVYFDENHKEEFRQIVLDEIIGAICERSEIVKVKKIMWPDVELKKNIGRTESDVHCLFLSDLHMDSDKFNKKSYEKFLEWVNKEKYKKFYIFVLGGVSSKKEDVENFLGNLPNHSIKIFLKGKKDVDTKMWDMTLPSISFIRLENSVSLLLCCGEFLASYSSLWEGCTPDKVMLNLLKKRHINPVFEFNQEIYEQDPFLLTDIPDIFVSGSFHIPSLVNYKGITVMSVGSFVSVPCFWLVNLKTRETIKLDFT